MEILAEFGRGNRFADLSIRSIFEKFGEFLSSLVALSKICRNSGEFGGMSLNLAISRRIGRHHVKFNDNTSNLETAYGEYRRFSDDPRVSNDLLGSFQYISKIE